MTLVAPSYLAIVLYTSFVLPDLSRFGFYLGPGIDLTTRHT
jgi:hypothetical protein